MKALRHPLFVAVSLVIAGAAAGCGVHEDKAVESAALKTSTQKQRADSFEATAQLLDEHPQLVDDLYRVMRKHPKAQDAFMKDATGDLGDVERAHVIAGFLADQPAAVEQVMSQSILSIQQKAEARAAMNKALATHSAQTADILADDPRAVEAMMSSSIVAIEKKPKARAAMNKALAAHSAQTADVLTDDPTAMAQVVRSLLLVTEQKPNARKNLVAAIHEDRQLILALVAQDKELSKAIAAEVLKEAVKDKPTLEKVLAATGALKEPADLAPKNAKME